ncbi:hypothetical protein [Geothrix limicola]|uniref:hypothetical protein n=1 Tax=Geothrix limicola TaxID=2927978 RepID=UPI00255605D9|nr:hypothetical protein [Geothrix limicola]
MKHSLRLLGACAVVSTPMMMAASRPSIEGSFEAFWVEARGRSLEDQVRLWDRWIEGPQQDLYASAVWEVRNHPDWKARKARLLEARFADYARVGDQIPGMIRILEKDLPSRLVSFRSLFPDTPTDLAVRVVVAPGFDAKSGVRADGSPVLLLAADSLLLEQANLDVLFPHELFHLYHARHAGILNDGVMPGARLLLPLFVEGLATCVSVRLAPGSTEGQLLLQEDLGAIPEQRLPAIATRFLAEADEPVLDGGPTTAFKRWFNAARTPQQPDLPNRAGYWLGLHVIRALLRDRSLQELASWPPARAEAETQATLVRIAGPRH